MKKYCFQLKPTVTQALLMVLCMVFVFSSSLNAQSKKDKKYNVVFIVSDDLNNDMACFDYEQVKTPNLDKLRAKGVTFQKNYNQYPLCGPSRASFMTGYRPDNINVENLAQKFRDTKPDAVTMPQAFMKEGYFAGRVGKIYHAGVPAQIGTDGHDDIASWQERVNPKGRDKTDEDKITWVNHMKGTQSRWLGGTLSYMEAEGTDEEQTDGMVAAEAVKMIKAHKDGQFFVAAGFYRPHVPFVAPKKYFDMYPLDEIQLPEKRKDDWDLKPEAAKFNLQLDWDMFEYDQKKLIQAYYASITFMDAQVGKILTTLKEEGLEDNTIIVFCSDHGYNLGHHGQWMKKSLFEHSARNPLIMYVPGMAEGKDCNRTVEMVDIYPTLADLCGVQAPADLDGVSLRPLLENPQAAWDRPAYTQVLRAPDPSFPGPSKVVRGRSLRTERYRYTEWNRGADGIELYDYDTDPNEFTNLAVNPAYSEMMKEFSEKLRTTYSKKF
ncbi:MAG: sulfatase [Draconibacterium sp.]